MLEGARKFAFPEGLLDGEPDAVLLCVPGPIVPYFRRFFSQMEMPYIWKTREDYQRAYPVFAAIEAQMTSTCASNVVDSIDRLYRLLDSALNGTTYTTDESTPPVVSPAIPAIPATPDGITAGLRRQLLDMQGVLPSGWPFGWGSEPATLADIVRALRNDSTSQVNRVKSTFDALQRAAQVATIFGTVASFLEEGASDVAEGGILATLIVSIMAQSAMMGAQAGQLDQLLAKMDRLVASLDGGAEPAPATNVISELEKTNTLLG